jgi:hypothetical protein
MRIDDGGYSTYTPPPHSDPPLSDTTQHGNGLQTQTVAAPARANPPPATPAQRVDLAVAKYKAAVASGDQGAIKQARQAVYTAVKDEIGPQVDTAIPAGTITGSGCARHAKPRSATHAAGCGELDCRTLQGSQWQ